MRLIVIVWFTLQLHEDEGVLARGAHPEADLQTAGGGAGQSAAGRLRRGESLIGCLANHSEGHHGNSTQ